MRSLLAIILVGVMFLTMTPTVAFAQNDEPAQSDLRIGQYRLTTGGETLSPEFISNGPVYDDYYYGGVIKLPAGTESFYLYFGENFSVCVMDDYDCVTSEDDGWFHIDFKGMTEYYDGCVWEWEQSNIPENLPDSWACICELDSAATRYYIQAVGESGYCFLVEVGGKNDPLNCYREFVGDEIPEYDYVNSGYSSSTPIQLKLYMGANGRELSDSRQEIYYTTDGTDPGIVNDNEINGTKYTGQITISKNTTLKARTRLDINGKVKWGGCSQKTYTFSQKSQR